MDHAPPRTGMLKVGDQASTEYFVSPGLPRDSVGQPHSLPRPITCSAVRKGRLQSLDKARQAIHVTVWIKSFDWSKGEVTFAVRIVNNNEFTLEVTQVAIKLLDTSGAEVGTGAISQAFAVIARGSASLDLTVKAPQNLGGFGSQVSMKTPFGLSTLGTV